MKGKQEIAAHWGRGDVYGRIVAALEQSGKPLLSLTVEDLAPVDHFHARGFPATVELADKLPIRREHVLLDIGCGIGGPARYIAQRFGCRVVGIDITPAFVEIANKLSMLVRLRDRVTVEQGDAQRLRYEDASFDGAIAQHVTMNIPDRGLFFAEVLRVLKPGGYFALTEHGQGPGGPVHYPVPWSEDGRGAYLVAPTRTRELLSAAGFRDIAIEDTGTKYLSGYRKAIERAERGTLPPLGTHILLGEGSLQKTRNAARNIEERRTHPIQLVCFKPAAR